MPIAPGRIAKSACSPDGSKLCATGLQLSGVKGNSSDGKHFFFEPAVGVILLNMDKLELLEVLEDLVLRVLDSVGVRVGVEVSDEVLDFTDNLNLLRTGATPL